MKPLLRQLTRRLRVRIRSGPCQGMWWSLPTRSRFLRGVYEARLAGFVAAALRLDDTFWDVGAHFGYYSLLASRTLSAGRCIAFEPDANNRWYLEHHVQWNKLSNVTTLPFALAAADATRPFGGSGTGGARLNGGSLQVPTRTIDSLVQSGTCPAPTFMKIDTEGAEAEVVGGQVFAGRIGVVCIATHGLELHAECKQKATAAGYDVHDSLADGLIVATAPGRSIPESAWKLLSLPSAT
ncbi:MAG: FkbM family methyltransferase [Verrucomicrobia bacterium]|nr:FkbM family methyltransferase [Verrucomicrobiota bacterium]